MKARLLLIFLLLSTAFAGKGQNLVPNGDFEQHTGCPTNMMQLDSSLFWMNPSVFPPGGSPDYFHQCGNFIVGVPSNLAGYQWANSGAAYGGISLWSSLPDFREYLESPLTSTLIANQCYRFEMYVSLSNNSKYTTDDIAVFFSDTAISGIANSLALPFTPQLNFTLGLTTDTVNWIPLTINYTATGSENFLIIGNFKNDSNSTSLLYNNNGNINHSYFYIEDVSLTPCATGIEEQNNSEAITIYPNPVKDELFVNCYSLSGKKEIVITDIMGKEIYRNEIKTLNFKLQTLNFIHGIYFLDINTGKEIFRKKFIKE